ncbi:MAG: glutathionylspermidine synthase family protein [Terracidiphilus sp.]
MRCKRSHDLREAGNSEPPALYGRLDLAYDGRQIKLLEWNAV